MLNVINEGYKIRLTDIPKPATFKNNHFEMYHSTFDAVSALLKSGGIREVETLVHVIKPLPMWRFKILVKKHLIIDFRYVNKFAYKDKIKFDDIKLIEQISNS